MVVDAVIDRMGAGRAPAQEAMMIVARRNWSDAAACRSAFSWNSLPVSSPDRLGSIRVAGLGVRTSR
ncbi:hypothetical protein ASF00_07545 [Sphingomonas sp. Leaf34]|nr:hypothetical protein ASF00_07545 [Sphingomonas sp. Leaf34]